MKKLLLAVLLCSASQVFAASNVLQWDDNSSNELNFNIERKAEACAGTGAFTEIATVPANAITYTDSPVTEGSRYCYRVAASNTAGKSGFSNTVERLVPFTVPAAPGGLKVQGGP